MSNFLKNQRVFLIGAVPFVAMALYFYPAMWTYMDENIYIALANVIRHGTIYADQAGIQVPFMVHHGNHELPQYPLGMPAIIAFFSFFGWRTIFLINLIFLLLGFFYFIRWLRFEGIRESYALLYLLYPPFVFYSRTVMTEIACAAFITIALYQFRRKNYFLSALILGFGLSIKNMLALMMIPMFAATLLEWYGTDRKTLWKSAPLLFVIGTLPGLSLVLLYNLISTGSLFTFAYSVHKGQPLSFQYFFDNLFLYAQSLSVIYPLLFVPVLIALFRKDELLLCAIALGFTFFYLLVPTSWILNNQRPELMQRLILQIRYLLPVLPVFLFLYARQLNLLTDQITFPIREITSFAFISLFVLTAVLAQKHQQYVSGLAELQAKLYRSTDTTSFLIADFNSSRLLNDIIAQRNWSLETELSATPNRSLNVLRVQFLRSGDANRSRGISLQKFQNKVGTLTIYRGINKSAVMQAGGM